MGGSTLPRGARARRLHVARPRALATRRSSAACRASRSAPATMSAPILERLGFERDRQASACCATACRIGAMATVEENQRWGSRSSRTRSGTSSTRGRCRTRSTRSPSRAPRGGTSGTTTASATSTSPRSSSTSRSATATRRWSRRSRSRPRQLATIGPPMATESRSRLGKLLAEVTPGDLTHVVLHERRRRGERERDQARPLVHGPAQGHRALSQLPRRDGRRDHAHRRPAPLARRAGHPRRRAHVRPVHLPLPGRPSRPVPGLHRRAAPRGDPDVRGRAHRRGRDPRDGHRDERDHRPARRLPAVDPRGLRPARDPADRRRGDGRLRPHRQVVRASTTGTSCRTSSRWPRASTRATCRSARWSSASRSPSGCATSSSPAG